MLSVNRKKCTGCGACESVCPFSAIELARDSEGFYYPKINADLCKNCGKCDKICPIESDVKCSNRITYSVTNKNRDAVQKSSSAGIFSEIARTVIAENGMVFGAGFDDSFKCVHKGADSEEELKSLIGSKYVQSYIGKLYKEVESQLLSGRKVLFAGTPCQVAGLKSYLNKEYENLFTADFICHGVPSPKVWEYYLKQICKLYNLGNITDVSFRDKEKGWASYSLKITGDKNEYSAVRTLDPYQSAFSRNITLRKSCYSCVFKENNRCSDITLGDFWGGNRYSLNFDDAGTSLVTVHTEKGEEIIKNLSDTVTEKTDLDRYLQNHNKAMIKSVKLTGHRKAFFKAFEKNPEDVAALLKTYVKKTDFHFRIEAYKIKLARGMRKITRLIKK